MGRASLVIDYKKLQDSIDFVEATEAFLNNYTDLCEAVYRYDQSVQPNGCCTTTKHRKLPIHPQQVYKALAAKLVTAKTQPGKRGRQAGTVVKRTAKVDKFSSNPLIMDALKDIEKDTPEPYQKLVERVKGGSMIAAMKLKCARCCGFTGAHKSCDAQVCDILPFNLLFWPKRKDSEDFEYDPMDKRLKYIKNSLKKGMMINHEFQ